MNKTAAEDTHMTDQALHAIKKEPGPGEGLSKSAKKRRREKERAEERKRADAGSWDNWNRGKGSGSKGEKGNHPRKAGKEFQTDREGNQICFKFSKGQPGACAEPCPDGRTHFQFCLGAHPNVQCSKAPSKGGGKK